MATNQLQATHGTGFLILHRPEQRCNSLWAHSGRGQRGNVWVIRAIAAPPPSEGKERRDPAGPLLTDHAEHIARTHCTGARRRQLIFPSHTNTAALGCVLVAVPWCAARQPKSYQDLFAPKEITCWSKLGCRKAQSAKLGGYWQRGLYSSPFQEQFLGVLLLSFLCVCLFSLFLN